MQGMLLVVGGCIGTRPVCVCADIADAGDEFLCRLYFLCADKADTADELVTVDILIPISTSETNLYEYRLTSYMRMSQAVSKGPFFTPQDVCACLLGLHELCHFPGTQRTSGNPHVMVAEPVLILSRSQFHFQSCTADTG